MLANWRRTNKRKALVWGGLVLLVVVTVMYSPFPFTITMNKATAVQTMQIFEDGKISDMTDGHVKFLGILQSRSDNTKAVIKLWDLEEVMKLYFTPRKDEFFLSKKGKTNTAGLTDLAMSKHGLVPLRLKDKATSVPSQSQTLLHTPQVRKTYSATKTILLWNTFYGHKYDYLGKAWPRDYCSLNKCNVTHDKSVLKSADAVLFHMWPADKWEFPKSRTPNQRYVFFLSESPLRYDYHLEKFDNFFNLTMTYRLDSDFPFRYGSVEKRKVPIPDSNPEWQLRLSKIKQKTRPVAWIVSHCKSDSLREKYVQELQKYIEVDIYGKCGPLQCLPKMSKKCYDMIETKYKFVLAFENSLCKDYATEKFFNNAKNHIVAVAYGGANYKKIMPPNSYIDVGDFKGPAELATFLLKLHHDETAYAKYLEWKKDYVITLSAIEWRRGFCRLCDSLHEDKLPHKSYTSEELHNYWGKQNCKAPNWIGMNE